jgi:parallel beta-helix repeat protein
MVFLIFQAKNTTVKFMKTILLLLFVSPFLTANAATYYFSANTGDDSRSFSQAQNASTPWRSLSKLNSIAYSLQPGDKVLLKRGETFYGSIIVKKSGTSGSPIFFGAYGSGDKPVITSLKTISDWVNKGNGIYESASAIPGTKVNIVLMNGDQQELGRYPNSNAANGGFLTFESHYSKSSITDNQLTSSPNWTGADVVIRKRRWVIDRDLITSHSGTKISYKPTASYIYEPTDKFGYFIENSIKTLDRLGEWYYNPSTHKLSIYFGSNSPSSYNVQAATGDDLVYAEKANYVVFDNLNIKGANSNTFYNKSGSYVSITNCNLSFASLNGVQAFMASNFKVEGCTIDNCNTDGIDLGYYGVNATIRSNKILNTFTFAGMGASGDGKGMAIHSNDDGAVIEYNEIRNCGFEGINFGGSNITVKNNYIDKFCYIKDDGGAIYTYGGPANNIPYVSNRKVIGNIMMNGLGAMNGAYNPYNSSAEGIYFDNGSMNVEVTGNTVFNVSDMALYVHNSKNIKVSGNTFYAPDFRKIGMLENANRPLIRGNSITNNIFFVKSRGEGFIFRKSEAGSSLGSFATISGNYYASLLDDNTSSLHTKVKAYDANAKFKDYTGGPRFEYNATGSSKNVSLDATYVDAKNVTYSGSITLPPYSAAVLVKTGSSGGGSGSSYPTVSITSPTLNSSFKATASIDISAAADDADGSVSKVEFYNGSTFLHTETTAPYQWTWNNVPSGTYYLTAKATDNSGKVTTSSIVKVSVWAARETFGNTSTVVKTDSATAKAFTLNTVDQHAFTFSLFPNPAVNKLHVNFANALINQKANLSIVNMSGNIIKNIPVVLSGKLIELDISSLSSGIYTLNLINANTVLSKKFIKIN